MKRKLQDYKIVRKIGSGAFGEIMQVTVKGSNQENYAMKKLSKQQILKLNKLHEAFIEREILLQFGKIASQLFVSLYETLNDTEHICMILELCEGGSLDRIIPKIGSMPNKVQIIRKIVSRIVIILEVMHTNKVVHRDLKPSNFLLHKNGMIKLADFGTAYAPEEFYTPEAAKQIHQFKEMANKKKNEKMAEGDIDEVSLEVRRSTFVGTPLYFYAYVRYMAPELLTEDFCGPEADLWALGCIIYEIVHGKTPFEGDNQGLIWKNIVSEDFRMPVKSDSNDSSWQSECSSLISLLLVKQRFKRLGYGEKGYEQLKRHPFFKGVDWHKIEKEPISELTPLLEKSAEYECSTETSSKSSNDPEKIMFTGLVNKKMYFGNYKQRMLVLHALPKLVYYDSESGEKKGEIMLKNDTPIVPEGNKMFAITNQKKTFYFKTPKAPEWIEMIKLSIINAYF